MKKTMFLFVLSLVVLVSCKEEKTKEVVAELPSKSVKVTISAIVKANDDFQLFFREEDNISAPFKEENSVWTKVVASDKIQNIEFFLPENIMPYYLRLDLGLNKDLQRVVISGMKIEFLDKKIEIGTSSFFDTYFIPNNSIAIKDKNSGEVITKVDEKGNYDPVFNSGENLKLELQNIYK